MALKFKYHKDGTLPENNETFVFGSNLRGAHGAGAAKVAHDLFGAHYGIGVGFCRKTYAIPTKDMYIETMPIHDIIPYIEDFVRITHSRNDVKFFLTRIGCGLAGYTDADIAPLFKGCNPVNCDIPEEWMKFLEDNEHDNK